jgi:menaquinone-dependent protoporphyrinogen IX oxidase
MSKFDVEVQLVGQDGNAYAIMGRVARALREAGATKAEIDEYHEQATSGDYDNLLRVTSEWVEVY